MYNRIFFMNRKFAYYTKSFSTKISSNREKWESVIGLEVHAQVNSKSKLFSSAGTKFKSSTNQSVSLFDAALPGTLPVINKRCVEAAVLTSLALKANLNEVSYFDRKHYFYADLPSGYQITQNRRPIAENGSIDFVVFNAAVQKEAYEMSVPIIQIQIEQDSGKSLHDIDKTNSLIDLNRAGIGLMEIVFAPCLKNGNEAVALIRELILILESLDTCSCKMEEGSLRVDANVSINKPGDDLGVRTEVKNINSLRGLQNAIGYEIKRQIQIKEKGGIVTNETRSYDPTKKITISMRDKEVLQDYRFMPEPNLPPLRLSHDSDNSINPNHVNIDKIRPQIKMLPEDIRRYLLKNYEISLIETSVIMNQKLDKLFIDLSRKSSRSPKLIKSFLSIHLLEELNSRNVSIESCFIKSEHIGTLIDYVESKTISLTSAKKVLYELFENNSSNPDTIIEEKNLYQINDVEKLDVICQEVIDENPEKVKKYLSGKQKLFTSIVGDVHRNTSGKANMKLVVEIISKKLKCS